MSEVPPEARLWDPWGALIRFRLQIGALCSTDASLGSQQATALLLVSPVAV
jgi:hypothetical protein